MIKAMVDITPHPRILQVLGEIEFKPWQCVAELIDNSVDSFLEAKHCGTTVAEPVVRVAFGHDTVVVKDNGPGMSLDGLEMAVKAGWTSHDKIGSLGLYGVGFNIATARLGSVTRIWTTQVGDLDWWGLEIDLRKLAKGAIYTLEVRTRTKSDPQSSGTEVEVSQLKPDWKNLLINSSWLRNNVTDRLSRIYGTMLRDNSPQPIRFGLYVNNKRVQAWEHCVWPADRAVYRKLDGDVRPMQEIDVTFGTKYLSKSTGEIADSSADLPHGLPAGDVVKIQDRVYGWIGIQRYADDKDYGVDILRNGRKIEIGCKDIFDWEAPDGDLQHEYPIDDPRQRGRIVGEIHLDHGYVHYTKHRFEREHSSWKQLLRAVRNDEPLTNREKLAFQGINTSKLGVLFRTFRRNSPQKGSSQGWSDLLFVKDNDKAKKWAEQWRKGDPDYRDESKWREELERSDKQKDDDGTDTAASGAVDTHDTGLPDGLNPNVGSSHLEARQDGTSEAGTTPAKEEPTRTSLPELNFHITGIGITGRSYDVEVFALDPANAMNGPWRSRATPRGVYEVEVNPKHPAFDSTSLDLRSAILAEVAHIISSEESASVSSKEVVTYGSVLSTLRARYLTTDSLDLAQLRQEVDGLRRCLLRCLSQRLTDDQRIDLFAHLPKEDAQRIEFARAQGPASASLIDYLDIRQLALLIERCSAPFFDGICFDRSWTPRSLLDKEDLLQLHRERLVRAMTLPLAELGEFANPSVPGLEPTRAHRSLVRAYINLVRECLAADLSGA